MSTVKTLRWVLALVMVSSLGQAVAAEGQLTIAAASDLKFALSEIVDNFTQQNPSDQIDIVYGSSGKFRTQIEQGAPYDIYFSADIAYPRALAAKGLAASEVMPYAIGRLVLWSATLDATKLTLASLTDARVRHIAIANPSHAPYGQRASEALHALGLWEQLEPKLVYGDNIAHTAQLVQSGNAEAGLIALSLAINPVLSEQGGYWLIPSDLHDPLLQGYIITSHGRNNELAKRFVACLQTEAVRAVMARYGFTLPDAAATQTGSPLDSQ